MRTFISRPTSDSTESIAYTLAGFGRKTAKPNDRFRGVRGHSCNMMQEIDLQGLGVGRERRRWRHTLIGSTVIASSVSLITYLRFDDIETTNRIERAAGGRAQRSERLSLYDRILAHHLLVPNQTICRSLKVGCVRSTGLDECFCN